jgi:transposase
MLIFAALIPNRFLQKKGNIGYDGHKKIKGVKLGAAVNDSGLPISVFIAPANTNDSKFYFPIMDGFKIISSHGRARTRPKTVIADASFDTKEIRRYNRRRRIKTVIPVNVRNKKKNKVGRPINFDKVLFKKRSSVERFFSRIEAYKKIYPRHERREDSYLGLVQMACAFIIWEEVSGWPQRIYW